MAYTVYWNNICLLSKLEKQFIGQQNLEHEGFDFEFYGLGQNMSLSEKIKEENHACTTNAKIIVSTDLEIFQKPALSKYFEDTFKSVPMEIPKSTWLESIRHPEGHFAPFIVIPLVFAMKKTCTVQSLKALIDARGTISYAFGGIHNSAGQSLLKAIWWLYGQEAVETFLKHAKIGSMPAQAYQMFASGQVEVSIVPTIFALRSTAHDAVFFSPQEGTIVIPSYIAVHKDVSDHDFDDFKNTYLNAHFQQNLKTAGDIWLIDDKIENKVLTPPWSFYKNFDYETFEMLCQKYA